MNTERKKKVENEQRLRMRKAGEVRREWIMKNNENEKIREMQAILKGLISAGVDASDVNFDMRGMRKEINRVERIMRVREIKREWNVRMKLEAERKLVREKKEKAIVWRGCREIVWEIIDKSMSKSEKSERMSVRNERTVVWLEKRVRLKDESILNVIEKLL